VATPDVQFDIDQELDQLQAQISRLVNHRDAVSQAGRGAGPQQGALLGKRAADLTVAVRDLESGLFRLRDIAGHPASEQRQQMPVAGEFEITIQVNEREPLRTQRTTLRVWPGKPTATLLREAVAVLANDEGGVWGLYRRGELIRELTVHDARIEPGDTLTLRREAAQ
jgi:hypothetical protein